MPTAARYSRPEVGRVLSAAGSPHHPRLDLPLLCCTSIPSHILHHLRTQQWLHSPCRRARLQPRLPTVGAGAACGVRRAACGMGKGHAACTPCTYRAHTMHLHTPSAHTLRTPCARRHAHTVQVRLAAASEQLSRLFEHTYVFQCYQPTYSSGHYAFMFASRTRLSRTRAARLAAIHPRGLGVTHQPSTRRSTHGATHPLRRPTRSTGPPARSLRAAPLWPHSGPSPQRPRRRCCGGAPVPAQSRLSPPLAVSVAPLPLQGLYLLWQAASLQGQGRLGRVRPVHLHSVRDRHAPPRFLHLLHTDGTPTALILGTLPRRSRRATTTPTCITLPSYCPRRHPSTVRWSEWSERSRWS
jgi:hypothetical protein